MISYIMIDGVNDSIENAKELIEMFKDKNVMINFIPFNTFDPYADNAMLAARVEEKKSEFLESKRKREGNPDAQLHDEDIEEIVTKNRFHGAVAFRPSKPERIYEIQQMCLQSGLRALERRPHGRDISAACGQLAKVTGRNDSAVYAHIHYYDGDVNKVGNIDHSEKAKQDAEAEVLKELNELSMQNAPGGCDSTQCSGGHVSESNAMGKDYDVHALEEKIAALGLTPKEAENTKLRVMLGGRVKLRSVSKVNAVIPLAREVVKQKR